MPLYMSSIAVAWILIYAPRILVMIASRQQFGRLENNHPRDQQAKLSGWGRRALAAHANAFESFAPFAAAVLVAHHGGGDPRWIEIAVVAYLVSRAAYIALYVANLGLPRTAVWAIGLLSTGCLFALPLVA